MAHPTRAHKQKDGRNGQPFIVPLARQALAILRELRELNDGRFMFLGRDGMKPVSENTITEALKRLEYGRKQTGHGFRGIFSTILNNITNRAADALSPRFHENWIEAQQDRLDKNKTRRAYNSADYLPQRAALMQWYADHLDALRDAGGSGSPHGGMGGLLRKRRKDGVRHRERVRERRRVWGDFFSTGPLYNLAN